jgi:general secretion pathway protein D
MDEHNRQVWRDLDRERQTQIDMQNKLAQKVDEFRELVHERRFPEAEVVAKQALELAPEDKVAQLLVTEAKMLRQYDLQMRVKADKEEGFLDTLAEVEKSAIPFSDGRPYVFPDAKTWREVTGRRAKYGKEQGRRLSERELEIRNKLRTPVQLQFDNAPLSKVIDTLSQLAGINIYLDPQGLAEEGVSTDTPINNLDLRQEIKLESALNLILRPLRLTYVIKDEVLKITSEQARKGEVYQVVYPVADLVIPIPNFVPHGGLGLDGAYRGAMANVNYGTAGPFASSTASPLAVVASRDGRPATGMIDPTVMAQLSTNNRGSMPSTLPISNTPGNLGGGAMADFDSLIDLIESTIQPDSWQDIGAGQGSIAPFEINLSLVVSNTQEVHEQIVDLLEQLRRMQDLQVTIEVRFITLNDTFLERIGVDFDAKLNDNINHLGINFGRMTDVGAPGNATSGTAPTRDVRQTIFKEFGKESSATVGWNGPVGDFTADLDIPFTQGSFGLGVPPLTSSFDPGAGVQTGFAILSDIEATFFINAAQRDQRTNVLQAPKVTLFNGQQAYVSDTSQSPFVVSVIPYVGDFAAAQQPVIVVLSEGTFLTVQAVVSPDKRFVRLTLVPFFSHIGKVDTFTFQGSTTTISDTSTEGMQDTPNDNTKKKNQREIRTEGTTVQLPTFSFVTVTTTVSVPDGGTVLMGGIKRLSEGRNEAGVPILNKIPYLNRLFKNVGITHDTQSLMMMVTPRIIIQEEEEAALLGSQPTP